MAATNGTLTGVYQGSSYATAFTNPESLDLIQVINEGGKVVWNLTSAGVANTNPASYTGNALLGQYFGSSFAAAFTNPSSLDLIQIVSPTGESIVNYVNYAGVAH